MKLRGHKSIRCSDLVLWVSENQLTPADVCFSRYQIRFHVMLKENSILAISSFFVLCVASAMQSRAQSVESSRQLKRLALPPNTKNGETTTPTKQDGKPDLPTGQRGPQFTTDEFWGNRVFGNTGIIFEFNGERVESKARLQQEIDKILEKNSSKKGKSFSVPVIHVEGGILKPDSLTFS